ncbi:MAG: bifunctional proline dehydrogenase/L-glutamate gamma-semialdehyde dehydrogenase PutA [Gammaproteobacteria bacterium]|nr:bifunctional proline dehydrogenase/L-glutamate gamma-semialdehyde dehydrogenase PutA [Gammaproteobacteria bacterium]
MQTSSKGENQSGGFIFSAQDAPVSAVGRAINAFYLADESKIVGGLLERARLTDEQTDTVSRHATRLVESVRRNRKKKGGLDAFLKKYDLSSQEGVVLMCLAEALLRIPDADTADRLIADKISAGNWKDHLGTSDSVFVNASTWGLMLTGHIIKPDREALENPAGYLARIAGRLGEPVIRTAMRQAMRIMGHQFVMGRNIRAALKRSVSGENQAYRHSFDMLGEAALSKADALRYFEAYSQGIQEIGNSLAKGTDINKAPGISVKLSALFPRYEFGQRTRVLNELTPRLLALAEQAKAARIALTIDAEEADRLEISMEVFAAVFRSSSLAGWEGFGLALQSYQKRARAQIEWLVGLARECGRIIPVRLVKGAYWDTEIKLAQENGLAGYPVYTRKPNTDVSYLACARDLLAARDVIYPQFASHNAHTVASIVLMAVADGAVKSRDSFEFQRLHGMGEELYDEVIGEDKLNIACRVYAPVGKHEDLLPYLVRRLLENGANSSFVNRIVDEKEPIAEIVADPVHEVGKLASIPHTKIPLPSGLYGAERKNSAGVNFSDHAQLEALAAQMAAAAGRDWQAGPIVGGKRLAGDKHEVFYPADHKQRVGQVEYASAAQVVSALDSASEAYPGWDRTPASERADCLARAADLFAANVGVLLAMCVREAGKSVPDGVAELREAIDFLRYYAACARRDFSEAVSLPGPTGESNHLLLHGRGVFVCISPWNFPLAIFTGQVAAALAAGNTVLAKPAAQTSLVAAKAVELLHEAGIPGNVLHFLPGAGAVIGAAAVSDQRVAGVAFTGSMATAQRINRSLAGRDGPIAVLIAETGGQNTMIVDSSALPEQVVKDVVQSAFNSAGQRCSALRVLCLQEEIAPRVIELLAGYMEEMTIGDPALLSTDIGPVIDNEAQRMLNDHIDKISELGKVVARSEIPAGLGDGSYVTPLAVEIPAIDVLEKEVFGPVLHIVRYKAAELDQMIAAINRTGFGLTLGVHSRIDGAARHIARVANVGNVYVNRNMVGAVVGVQPFGGCGLSGTGPKAGGPFYLHRFASEKTITINTAAVGGNASLLSLETD